MNIEKAQRLQVGDTVHYPEDRGTKAGSGKISHIGQTVNTSYQGNKYIWVSIQGGGVWPSNRLS